MLRNFFMGTGWLIVGLGMAIVASAGEIRIEPSEDWEWDVDGIERLLPRWETPEERAAYEGVELPGRLNDPPPLQSIRNVAEFDAMTGVLIRYPLGLPYNLLREMNEDVVLSVVVSSSSYSAARSNFQSNGIDPAEVDWIIAPNNSIWTRDYGPWFVFDGNGEIAIINHTYNRPWRPDDNNIPLYCGAQWGMPVYSHDLWHTGGNYMTDGCGISFSTDLVWDENGGMTHEQIFDLMHDYYGLSTYHVVPDISNTGIHHIDTWAKLLDEETVIMKEVSPSHGDYPELEQNATLIASLASSTGRNYEVVRVYCQSIQNGGVAAYTNSLILNDKVLVPTFNNATYDPAALQAYRDAMPGYEVLGFSYSGWLTDDALHCRAKGVADRGMLYVRHVPLREWSTHEPIPIRAMIDDRSEAGLKADSLLVHWRAYVEGSPPPPFAATVLEADEDPDWYVAEIPAQPSGWRVDYYVHAADWSGRRAGMPRTEPDAHYSFLVDWPAGVADLSDRGGARLDPAFPNPFFPATTFSFELRHEGRVRLAVHDVQGRLVRTLLDGSAAAGRHEIAWDGRNDAGIALPAGAYFYRLRAAGITYTRAATLAK